MNGEVVQSSNTSDMIFSVPELIAFLSQGTTLLPGTIVLTGVHQLLPRQIFAQLFLCAAWVLMGAGLGSGTPEGVGFTREPPRHLAPGDTVTVAVEGIGELTNPVVEGA